MAPYQYQDVVPIPKDQTNLVKCTLCCMIFDNVDNVIKDHFNGSRHKGLYLKRMRITNSIVDNDDEIHCKLCDDFVCETESYYEIKLHIKSSQHEESFRSIEELIEGEFLKLPEDVTSKGSKVSCSICNCFLSGFTYREIEVHINGLKHKKARAKNVQQLNGIFQLEGTNEELWCKICDTEFDNNVDTILDHVDNDDDHASKLRAIEEVIDNEAISIDKYLSSIQENKAYCSLCAKSVPCNIHNLEEHISGSNHKKAFAMSVEPLNGIFTVEGTNEELWCKICKEYLDNTVEEILAHVEDDSHTRQLDGIEELIEDEDISIKNYLTDFSNNLAYCNKCGVRITCNEYNLRQHIQGNNHSY